MSEETIKIIGAQEHNLTGWDADIPLGKMTVITGPSGSGKTSFALHTLYAEGQRRYVETFSPYVRQFLERMGRPRVQSIEPIPPALALEQKNRVRTSRSTVGTMTELTEYWKFVFSNLAIGHHPTTGEIVKPIGADEATERLIHLNRSEDWLILFPVPIPPHADSKTILEGMQQGGFLRYFWEGSLYRTDDDESFPWEKNNVNAPHHLLIVQDRLKSPTSSQSPEKDRLTEALGEAFRLGKDQIYVAHRSTPDNKWKIFQEFRQDWSPLIAPEPGLFSFNSALGACPTCRGFGKTIDYNFKKALSLDKSIDEGGVSLFSSMKDAYWSMGSKTPKNIQQDLLRCAREKNIPTRIPLARLTKQQLEWICEGEWRYQEGRHDTRWYGLRSFFTYHEKHANKMLIRMFLGCYRKYVECPSCHGDRLRPEALCFTVEGKTLPELMRTPISELLTWVQTYIMKPQKGQEWTGNMAYVSKEIFSRLYYLEEVGLGYLTLDRATRSLSGGEIERVNLTISLGSSLTHTLFVLDEPTVGLHPRDTQRLINIMHKLRDRGNTLAVVEHEEAVMRSADWIVDIGPGSGDLGGQKIYAGSLEGLKKCSQSLTSDYLYGRKTLDVPSRRRKPKKFLHLKGGHQHNIKNLTIDIPLGVFTCLTGVSGSGKSTLAYDLLYLNAAQYFGENIEEDPAPLKSLEGLKYLSGVCLIDQSPLVRTPRSTPAVYIKAFDYMRALFAETEEAKSSGLTAGYFSFNSGDGRCPRCAGAGFEKIEMQFLSDVYIPCADCQGKRYTKEALSYLVDGKSMTNVLEMSVTTAIHWLNSLKSYSSSLLTKASKAAQSLKILEKVGLGHLKLGQGLNTLSGGENQRLKLAGLLLESGILTAKPTKKKTNISNSDKNISTSCVKKGKLLLLDEPSTGLHFSDIAVLLEVFQILVKAGHTLLVIEHNTEIIKSADYILDLGPEGGSGGGQLVAQGTPEEIAQNSHSLTGQYLAPLLIQDSTYSHSLLKKNSTLKELSHQPELENFIHPPKDILQHFSPTTSWASLRGAKHHNLKNVDIDIPLGQITVLSGLSGSGKSSLAFGIFFEEGQRRFLDIMSPYARQFTEQQERPECDALIGLPPTVAIEQNVSRGGSKSTVGTVTEIWDFFRLLYSKLGTLMCPKCGIPTVRLSRDLVAEKAYKMAQGEHKFTLMAPLVRGRKGNYTDLAEWANKKGYAYLLVDGTWIKTADFTPLDRYKIHDIDLILGSWLPTSLPDYKEWNHLIGLALKYGKGVLRWENTLGKRGFFSLNRSCPQCGESFDDPELRLFSYNSPHGWCPVCRGHGVIKKGLNLTLDGKESLLEAELRFDKELEKLRENSDDSTQLELEECPSCHGSRLNALARSVQLQGFSPDSLAQLSIQELRQTVDHWHFSSREQLIAHDALIEIKRRLEFLHTVGLHYLQLNRSVMTLSGGELQRIRLSAQLGSNIQGVFYVLDEPTIGLHARDNEFLIKSLQDLKKRGNTLLIVEHDTDVMSQADWVVDLGPGAGRKGGKIVAQGLLKELLNNPHSVTGQALNHPLQHPIRGTRRLLPKPRAKSGWIKIKGAHAHNLKNINVAFALGRLNVVTGVSGAGKTSLVTGVLYPALKEHLSHVKNAHPTWENISGLESLSHIYRVDQSPIGRTPRSTPGTYVGFFDDIRALYASTPEAKQRGFAPGRFSFNTKSGHCPACKGNGVIKWEMAFLPPSYKTCEICHGERYNSQTLEVTYHGKTIADVLNMSIEEAAQFFESIPKVRDPLRLLRDTGLGYLKLGQPSSTLSGGEAQRLKLVTELIKGVSLHRTATLRGKELPKSLYIIEEPTIGLHPLDVRRLIDVLHRLVDQGNTVIVIEHEKEIIAEADYLIDLGPEAGDDGGQLVTSGTPEEVAISCKGHTARYLKEYLNL